MPRRLLQVRNYNYSTERKLCNALPLLIASENLPTTFHFIAETASIWSMFNIRFGMFNSVTRLICREIWFNFTDAELGRLSLQI